MKIRTKLIVYFLLLLALQASVIIAVTSDVINSRMELSVNDALNKNLKAARIQYYARAYQMRFGMLQAASQEEIKEAVFTKDREYLRELMAGWKEYRPYVDLWLIVDSKGVVIADIESSGREGKIFVLNSLATKAIEQKEALVSTEVSEGMMMLSAATPVIKNNAVVGAIVTGDAINGDDFIPKTLEENIPGIIVSIGQGKEIISTNIKNEDGEAITGTDLGKEILEKVLLESTFTGDVLIGKESYRVAVEPVKDNTGRVIGAIFVGVPKTSINVLRDENTKAVMLIAGLTLLSGFFTAFFLSSRLSKPINALTQTARKLSSGDFEARASIRTRDEIGELASVFNSMAGELKKLYASMEDEVKAKTGEIQQAKNFLENLIESMRDGVVFVNSENRIVLANSAAGALRGVSVKEIIGTSILDCHPAEYHAGVAGVINEIEEGKPFSHRVIKVKEKYIENVYAGVGGIGGGYVGVLVVSRDITERMNLERQIEQSNKELLLLQNINNLLNKEAKFEDVLSIITEGLTGVFGYNSAVVHLLNEEKTKLLLKSYSADSRVVKKIEELTKLSAFDYETPLYDGSLILEMIKSRKPLLTEDIASLAKSHTTSSAVHQLAPLIAKISGIKSALGVPLLAGDEAVGIIGVSSRNKLSRGDAERLLSFAAQIGLAIKKAKLENEVREYAELLERKVQEKSAELIKSEKIYRTLVETMNEGLVAIDESDSITFCNKKFSEIFETAQEEVMGKSILDFFKEDGFDSVHEAEIKTKKGRQKNLLVSWAPLHDESGEYRGKFGVVADITERKKMEQQIAQSDKLASIGQLAAGIAHEINSPLANIMLYASLLKEELAESRVNPEDLDTIIKQVNAASKIVKDLLEFSRQYKPEFSKIDVNELLEKSLSLLQYSVSADGIKVLTEFKSAPRIYADPHRLQQVFFNILLNAYQAMPDGGVLKIRTGETKDSAEIKISDTGMGIPMENIDKIFDPFFTTKEVGKGTGLGLSVALGIIKEHSGAIEVESEINKGSAFIIKLPKGNKNE